VEVVVTRATFRARALTTASSTKQAFARDDALIPTEEATLQQQGTLYEVSDLRDFSAYNVDN